MPEKIPVTTIEDSKTSDYGKGTVDLYAKREKIYVREIKGVYQRFRKITLNFFLGAYFLACWVNWNGQQAIYFDLPNREFHLFGTTFFPQDFILVTLMLIICAFGLFFITTLFGRVWCGYTCPQTVWTFIFMWIEERIEGSRNRRIKLDKAPLSFNKVWRKGLKHTLWLLVAFLTGLTFVGYFYPIRILVIDLATWQATGTAVFWIAFFTLATYGNAGWMREQVCLYMCPYARFQSVMFDRNTLIVSYKASRGEARGKRRRDSDPKAQGLGDCIDCGLCVQVCPTGIDIRDGLQYECIGCALCIDACDGVMEKMGYPKRLIGYTTENELENTRQSKFRLRSVGYGLVLTFIAVLLIFLLVTRTSLELDVIRDRGSLFNTLSDGRIENTYTIKSMNKDSQGHFFRISVDGIEGATIVGESRVYLSSNESAAIPLTIQADPANLAATNQSILFSMVAEGRDDIQSVAESRFIGPFSP